MQDNKINSIPSPWKEIKVKVKGETHTLVPEVLGSSTKDEAYNKDLFDAVISLYRHVLPSLGKTFLVKLLSDPKITTIVLMRPVNEVKLELELKALNPALHEQDKKELELRRQLKIDHDKQISGTDGIEDMDDDTTSSFSYDSDEVEKSEEDDEEEEDAEDDDEDQEGGRKKPDLEDECLEEEEKMITNATAKLQLQPNAIPEVTVNAKSRIVGCISFEFHEPATAATDTTDMLAEDHNDKGRILQITLVGVRLKYQRLGLGSKLLELVLNNNNNCNELLRFDDVITYADHSSVDFWKRHNFTDDIVINSKFRHVADNWDQSVMMSRMPPPPSVNIPSSRFSNAAYIKAKDLDDKLEKWRLRKIEQYADDLRLVEVLRQEIQLLRERVANQERIHEYTQFELSKVKRNYSILENEFREYKEHATRQIMDQANILRKLEEKGVVNLQQEFGFRLMDNGRGISRIEDSRPQEAADNAAVTADIASIMRTDPNAVPLDPTSEEFISVSKEIHNSLRPQPHHGVAHLRITHIVKRLNNNTAFSHLARFNAAREKLHNSTMIMRLYHGEDSMEKLKAIFSRGFSLPNSDAGNDCGPQASRALYGKGVYFSPYANKVHHLTCKVENTRSHHCMVMALVAVGNVEPVVSADPQRSAPPTPGHYDSIVTPGRQLQPSTTASSSSGLLGSPYFDASAAGHALHSEEYVVFEPDLALPLYLVYYTLG